MQTTAALLHNSRDVNVAPLSIGGMGHPNSNRHPQQGQGEHYGDLGSHHHHPPPPGWTPQQSREYNDLIQQQLDVRGGGGGYGDDSGSVGSLGSIPLQPGEMVEDRYERPTSAPPPGFVGPDAHDRNRFAEEAIFGMGLKPTAGHGHGHNHMHLPTAVAHSNGVHDDDAYSGVTGDSDSAERGFSLTNLVDALGSGLGDSADETSGGQQTTDTLLRQRLADNPNLQRQTRHNASRLIGAPGAGPVSAPPGVSAFAPSPLFGPGASAPSAAAPHGERGFPSSLSSPNRTPPPPSMGGKGKDGGDLAEKKEVVHRATTPVQMHPGQGRGSYPLSKDIGVNVDEPTDGDGQFRSNVVSKRVDDGAPPGAYGNQGDEYYGAYGGGGGSRGGKEGPHPSTLNSQSKEFRPATNYNDVNDGTSTISDAATDISPRMCEAELDPFLWEIGGRSESSRTIAILHASWLKPPEVRSECEQFGALESFRAEFAPKGIFFASYYDIRSGEIAAAELQGRLQRIVLLHGSSDDVVVRFCLPLNSSSQFDESQIVINGLSDDINEGALTSMLRSYGAIRSCLYQGPGSFLVEFQNVQDAKQASLELESSLPWGPDVTVEVSPRNPSDRRKGRELLSTISRWRQGMGRSSNSNGGGGPPPASSDAHRYGGHYSPNDYNRGRPPMGRQQHDGYNNYGGYGGGGGRETVTQLIMGPDGRYTPVVVQNAMGMPSHGGQFAVDHRGGGQQHIIHGPNGQIFISSVPSQHVYASGGQGGYPPTIITGAPYGDGASRRNGGSTPYYSHSVASDNLSVHSGRSHGTHGTGFSHHSTDDKDNRHLMLDLDAVEGGHDTRTSLMVRNIPNKYTQQMLLSEFTENGHGPGVIDFFYLPIDFKNRCNRGYAFINFVSYQDIMAFHRRYYGKQWRTFNSDKICDITYARIQGKAAMLKRFENSALMDKDDEYKPLVFASDGPDKGKRLPFADPANKPV